MWLINLQATSPLSQLCPLIGQVPYQKQSCYLVKIVPCQTKPDKYGSIPVDCQQESNFHASSQLAKNINDGNLLCSSRSVADIQLSFCLLIRLSESEQTAWSSEQAVP